MNSENNIAKEKNNQYLWTVLKWYLIAAASFYFFFVLPKMFQVEGGIAMERGDWMMLYFQTSNYLSSALMFLTKKSQQSKSGIADLFLKILAVQQFLMENIFGMFLSVMVWYKLPYKIDSESVITKEKKFIQPEVIKMISIINLVIILILKILNFI